MECNSTIKENKVITLYGYFKKHDFEKKKIIFLILNLKYFENFRLSNGCTRKLKLSAGVQFIIANLKLNLTNSYNQEHAE